MTRTKYLEVSNFTLKFGDKNLLDLVEEVVIPAFMPGHTRKYGKITYFFHRVSILELSDDNEEPLACIAGRFIKDTVLTRSQVYDKSSKSLVEDEESIQSSPSALFILILNSHRLLYLEETAFAPPLSAFTKTIKSFIFESHSQFMLDLQNTGLSQQEVKREYPTPELKIIPISNTTNLRQFVNKYIKVESVIVKLYKTNSTSNINPFFEDFAEKMNKMKSSVSTLKYENKTEGLNENEIIDQLQEIASQANYHFNLRGKDTEGNTLSGSNEDIKVKVPMPEIPEELESASQAIVSKYQKLIGSGILLPPNIIDSVRDKIEQILNRFVRARENETD